MRHKTETACPHLYLYAGEDFSPFHLSIPLFVLGGMAGAKLFEITAFGEEKRLKDASKSLTFETEKMPSEIAKSDILLIPDWPSVEKRPSPALTALLRQANEKGALIVGLCLGAYVLSYAGLTENKRVATHWAFEADFLERFPKTPLDINRLYVEDGNLLTAAGGKAGLDCCLYLVQKFYGTKKANEVARWIVFPVHRDGGQAQFIDRPLPQTASEERLREILPWIAENLDKPHSVSGLSAKLWMSKRSFNRHFQKLTGESFKEWLMSKRLEHAQKLLSETTLRINDIAYQVGYPKEQSFRSAFIKKFKTTPSKWRKENSWK